MELIEYLKENHWMLQLRAIEKKCDIPLTTLKGVIYNGRKIKPEYAERLIKLLSVLNKDLTYNKPASKKSKEPILMKRGEWKPTLRGYWTNGVVTRLPIHKGGYMYYVP